VIEWTGDGSGSGTWSTVTNWDGAPDADVLFGDDPSGPEEAVEVDSAQTLGSIWLDAAVAYVLDGAALTLGSGLADGEHLVAVMSTGGDFGAETNIANALDLADNGGTPRTWVIENESEGGLRFGGPLDLGTQNLLITGGQATHFHGDLTGTGSLTITGQPGNNPTHLALQGNNYNSWGSPVWTGGLDIYEQGFGIIKSGGGLGSGSNTVHSGGSLAWRTHLGGFLYTNGVPAPIEVEGMGVIRQAGTLPVGAIYHDGGPSLVRDQILLTGDTWFGARGDQEGSLTLQGKISDGGAGHAFIKVGPGLIVLNVDWSASTDPTKRHTWGKTILRDGVLRLASEWALPAANLEFDGGTLELSWSPNSFTRDLGIGTGQVQWTGDGGFSASASNNTVTLNGGSGLTWGQQYFVQDGHALLFGSRYGMGNSLTFTNALDLGTSATGSHREIRVAETGIGKLTGTLTGTNSSTGLLKTGHGLLHLAGENTYTGDTVVAGGALRGDIPSLSRIVFDGGVIGIDSDFNRLLGSATAGRVRWQGDGGFAAYGGGDRFVSWGNPTTPATWGSTAFFVGNGHALRFGHSTADGTVFWDKPLNLGSGARTIYLERSTANKNNNRADVVFNRALSSTAAATLTLIGDGRLDIAVANPGFAAAQINIFGAELRLHGYGKLDASPISFLIKHGGTLWLNDRGDHQSGDTGGISVENRLNPNSDIILAAGNIIASPTADSTSQQNLGRLTLASGANEVTLEQGSPSILIFKELLRSATSRATLDIGYGFIMRLGQSVSAHAINDDGGVAVIPWATTLTDWTVAGMNGTEHVLAALHPSLYNTGAASTWTSAHNVHIDENGTESLSTTATINSLNIRGTLDLDDYALNLNSGGLMAWGLGFGLPVTITGNSGSTITTASNRPLYVHVVEGALTIGGSVAITGGMDLVKTRIGPLVLASNATHKIGSLYIHQGRVVVQNGWLSTSGTIFIGDGAGNRPPVYTRLPGAANDILELPANRRDPLITPTPGVYPSIVLHGPPYQPHGPEYEDTPQAVLIMGGNTKQHLANLHIEKRGTIDWVGGEIGLANILYLDTLTFSGHDAILFMRNWYEYEDILLVRSGGFDLSYLQNIRFEGYENFPNIWRRYDANYYQITPFGSQIPEPSTYGAILGTVGLGLWAWRRRKRAVPAVARA